MIPLGDASRHPSRLPAVTILFILVNVFVFLLELVGGEPFIYRWAMIPAEIVAGQGLLTIVSGMFLHGSWSHIIGNMIFLWAFGPQIESAMGPGRYLGFYFLGGLAAALAQIAGDPLSSIPNVGASGSIAAVMGAFLVTYPHDRIRTLLFFFVFVRIAFLPAALLIGFWFLTQLFSAGVVAPVQTGGVAYLAHIGGFIFGAATARLFESRRRAAWQGGIE